MGISGGARAATLTQFLAATHGSANNVRLVQNSSDSVLSNRTYGGFDGGGESRVEWYNNLDGSYGWDKLTHQPSSGIPATNWAYKTFCVEKGEHFTPGSNYYVTIDDKVFYGTDNGKPLVTSGGQSLSATTRVAYGLYMEGQLTSLPGLTSWSYDSHQFANGLQNLIWNQEELTVTTGLTADGQALLAAVNNWRNSLLSADQALEAHFLANVKVLNFWDQSVVRGGPYPASFVQAQLIYTGNAANIPPMPEPTSVVVWAGITIVGALAIRKRRSNSPRFSPG